MMMQCVSTGLMILSKFINSFNHISISIVSQRKEKDFHFRLVYSRTYVYHVHVYVSIVIDRYSEIHLVKLPNVLYHACMLYTSSFGDCIVGR